MTSKELRKRVQAAVLRAIDPMEELPFLADLPVNEAERVIDEFIHEVQEECFTVLVGLDTALLDLLTPPVLYATYRQHGIALSRETLLRICEEILAEEDEMEIVCDVEMDDPIPVEEGDVIEETEQKVYLVTMTI